MSGLLALTALAFAAPPAEAEADLEAIVVWADPLGPWDDTRWYVASETLSPHNALDVLTTEGRFRASAWQVEAVLHCHIERRKRFGAGGIVACSPEDVAIRVATDRSWQRPADQQAAQDALDALASDVRQAAVRLRVTGPGSVHIRTNQSRGGGLAAKVLERALDAFHLDVPKPLQDATERDWEAGIQWATFEEPLLALDAVGESFGLERAVHHGNRFRDASIIQTVAEAHKDTVIETFGTPAAHRDPTPEERFRASWRADQKGPPEEQTLRSVLRLDALAVFDPALGFVTERVWHLQAFGSLTTQRSGRIQLLGTAEEMRLGATGQVSPPYAPRPGLPPWLPVDPQLAPDVSDVATADP